MRELPGIVLEELGRAPTIETVALQEPGPHEVMVWMAASGICHTDIGYIEYARACPVILGHEGAGIVELVGETSLLWAMRSDLVNLGSIPEGEALDGVLGDEPRGAASAEKGRVLLETIAERTAYVALRLLENTSPMQRIDYMSALHVAVRILEKLQQQRRVLPKKEVAAVTTPAYQAYCRAIFSGDYRAAKEYAEKKLASLSA